MDMRSDVLSCLRERLLNQTGEGRIFEREEDQVEWLVGGADSPHTGFLSDPARALERPVIRRTDAGAHPGVDLTPEEAEALRLAVSRVARGGLISRGSPHAVLLAGALTFLGPIMAGTGGY